jgi:hypothetical protein
VINLLKGYFKIGDRDDHRDMRAKVLGRSEPLSGRGTPEREI